MTSSIRILVLVSVELERSDITCRLADGHYEVVRACSVDHIGRARRRDGDTAHNAGPSKEKAKQSWPQHDG